MSSTLSPRTDVRHPGSRPSPTVHRSSRLAAYLAILALAVTVACADDPTTPAVDQGAGTGAGTLSVEGYRDTTLTIAAEFERSPIPSFVATTVWLRAITPTRSFDMSLLCACTLSPGRYRLVGAAGPSRATVYTRIGMIDSLDAVPSVYSEFVADTGTLEVTASGPSRVTGTVRMTARGAILRGESYGPEFPIVVEASFDAEPMPARP